jgi:hypothetical protein
MRESKWVILRNQCGRAHYNYENAPHRSIRGNRPVRWRLDAGEALGNGVPVTTALVFAKDELFSTLQESPTKRGVRIHGLCCKFRKPAVMR